MHGLARAHAAGVGVLARDDRVRAVVFFKKFVIENEDKKLFEKKAEVKTETLANGKTKTTYGMGERTSGT